MLRRPRGLLLACSLTSSLARAAAFAIPSSCATLAGALREAQCAFTQNGVPEATLSAEYLLTRAAGLGSSRAQLALHLDSPLREDVRLIFESMCEQRLRRVPVQYILGDWDFHELTLSVKPPVLIPRPETEQLVELVLAAHRSDCAANSRSVRFLDVGCGTGAIGLALLNKLHNATCVGLDIRLDAANLALFNAKLTGLDDRYRVEHIEGGVAEYFVKEDMLFDVLVSNPPYIPSADMISLEPEVVSYEDERALCGGADGLDVIRTILTRVPSLLRREGPRMVWLEVDPSHPPLIEQFISGERADLGLALVRVHDDQFGFLRFCQLQWQGTT